MTHKPKNRDVSRPTPKNRNDRRPSPAKQTVFVIPMEDEDLCQYAGLGLCCLIPGPLGILGGLLMWLYGDAIRRMKTKKYGVFRQNRSRSSVDLTNKSTNQPSLCPCQLPLSEENLCPCQLPLKQEKLCPCRLRLKEEKLRPCRLPLKEEKETVIVPLLQEEDIC